MSDPRTGKGTRRGAGKGAPDPSVLAPEVLRAADHPQIARVARSGGGNDVVAHSLRPERQVTHSAEGEGSGCCWGREAARNADENASRSK